MQESVKDGPDSVLTGIKDYRAWLYKMATTWEHIANESSSGKWQDIAVGRAMAFRDALETFEEKVK